MVTLGYLDIRMQCDEFKPKGRSIKICLGGEVSESLTKEVIFIWG